MDWLALGAPLRAEILGLERLEDHARDVAAAHGPPSRDVPAQNLLESFKRAKRDIERAYVALAGEAQRNRQACRAL